MVCGRYPKNKDLLEIGWGEWFEPGLSDDCCHLIRLLLQQHPAGGLDWMKYFSSHGLSHRIWLIFRQLMGMVIPCLGVFWSWKALVAPGQSLCHLSWWSQNYQHSFKNIYISLQHSSYCAMPW